MQENKEETKGKKTKKRGTRSSPRWLRLDRGQVGPRVPFFNPWQGHIQEKTLLNVHVYIKMVKNQTCSELLQFKIVQVHLATTIETYSMANSKKVNCRKLL